MKQLFMAIIIGISAVVFSCVNTGNTHAQSDHPESVLHTLEFEMARLYAQSAPSVVRIVACPEEVVAEDGTCPAETKPNNRIGTGFIVHSDGYLLTTAEIASQPGSLIVMTPDDWQYEAKLIASDEKLDIALLKIDKKGLPALVLGSACASRPGHLVMSITNPYGLTNSMAWGVINGRHRTGLRPGCVENYLQTTLPLNPGDSGSPLINTRGEVIGVMVAALVDETVSHSDAAPPVQAQGISFALPVDLIKKHIPYMIKHGQAKHSWVGVEIKNITQNDVQRLDLKNGFDPSGVVIARVFPESPASEAGLREDDVVMQINDTPVSNVCDMQFVVATIPVDSEIHLTIIRDNDTEALSLTTREMPDTIPDNN